MKEALFRNIRIAYMRRIGPYGSENEVLMAQFKEWVRNHNLASPDCTYLAIALDNPFLVDENKLRYDVGLIIDDDQEVNIETRYLASCTYQIYEVTHTHEAISSFYQSINEIDFNRHLPIIERYCNDKLKDNLCEICLPIRDD